MKTTHEYECARAPHGPRVVREVIVRLGESSEAPRCPVCHHIMQRAYTPPSVTFAWKRGR